MAVCSAPGEPIIPDAAAGRGRRQLGRQVIRLTFRDPAAHPLGDGAHDALGLRDRTAQIVRDPLDELEMPELERAARRARHFAQKLAQSLWKLGFEMPHLLRDNPLLERPQHRDRCAFGHFLGHRVDADEIGEKCPLIALSGECSSRRGSPQVFERVQCMSYRHDA
jgi:hypothetical protein